MGNQLAGIAPSQIYPVDYYLSQIKELQYEASMGSTRFMKVARARAADGTVVVKVFVLHDPALCVRDQQRRCRQLLQLLAPLPHCLPYSRATVIADKFAILVRQHIRYGLYDRLSTRPFLSDHEKRWLSYQLLVCLAECHARRVCHGDLKLENLLVTSSLWLTVADWASYKPAFLAEDNPADFGYFFDASRRRLCYIAPERFVSGGELEALECDEGRADEAEAAPAGLCPAMDMFSAGCCLIELWSDGACVPFDLPQLLAYRQQGGAPQRLAAALEQHVADTRVREMLEELVALDPGRRPSAQQCLQRFTARDDSDRQQQELQEAQHQEWKQHREPHQIQELHEAQQQDPKQQEQDQHLEAQLLLQHRVLPQHKEQLDLGEQHPGVQQQDDQHPEIQQQSVPDVHQERESCVFPASFRLTLHSYMVELHMNSGEWSADGLLDRLWRDLSRSHCSLLRRLACDGNETAVGNVSLLLSLVVSCCRRLEHSVSKLRCVKLICMLCTRLPLHVTVDRALPYLLRLSEDAHDARVRRASLVAVCQLLTRARRADAADLSALMPEYVWPCLWPLAHDRSVSVRRCFARHLAALADTALRLLLAAHARCVRPTLAREVGALRHTVRQRVQTVLADSDAAVRRALLVHGFVPLCRFFGRHCAADLLLSHMATFVNAGGLLRAAFYGAVDSVVSRLGVHSLSPISPLLLQGVSDVDEMVAGAAVNALVRLAQSEQAGPSGVGLLAPGLTEGALREAVPLLVHPSLWLRQAAVGLVCACAGRLSPADVQCRLMPLLSPAITPEAVSWLAEPGDPLTLMTALREPVPRALFDWLRSAEGLSAAMVELDRRLNGGSSDTPGDVHNQEQDLLSRLPAEQERRSLLLLAPLLLKLQQRRHQAAGPGGVGSVDVSHCRLQKHRLHHSVPPATELPSQRAECQFRPQCCHLLERTLTNLHQNQLRSAAYVAPGCGGGSTSGFQQLPSGWRPRGLLVAHLHEHSAAVVRLAALPDSALFASASRDGQMRLWDVERMEGRNVANRSVGVFECERLAGCEGSSPLTGLVYCPGHTALASSNENGAVFTLSVERCQQQQQNQQQKLLPLHMRRVDVARDGCVTDMAHIAPNMLVFATGCGQVIGWDLRCDPQSGSSGWTLSQGPRHGLVTALCVDRAVTANWLVVGTSNGLHNCWDLRFQLPVTKLCHPDKLRVRRLVAHPFHPSWFISAVSANCEVDMWNIETGERQVVLWPSPRPPLSSCQRVRHSICALHVPPYGAWPCHHAPASGGGGGGGSEGSWLRPSSLLLTGGTDMFCRVWDLQQPIRSRLLTWPGLQLAASAAPPTTAAAEAAGSPFVVPTASPAALAEHVVASYRTQVVDGIQLVQECLQRRALTSSDQCRRGPDPVPPGHVDTISDLITTRASQWLLVSASHDGVVKVWK